MLQKPLKLHDMEVIHITFDRSALELADQRRRITRQTEQDRLCPNAEQVDNAQHLVVRDISLP